MRREMYLNRWVLFFFFVTLYYPLCWSSPKKKKKKKKRLKITGRQHLGLRFSGRKAVSDGTSCWKIPGGNATPPKTWTAPFITLHISQCSMALTRGSQGTQEEKNQSSTTSQAPLTLLLRRTLPSQRVSSPPGITLSAEQESSRSDR